MAKGRHELRAARTTWPLIVGLVAGVLLLALGGVAFAAYRYEQANADRILMGTTVAGIDVSGMTRAEAIAAVRGGRPRRSPPRDHGRRPGERFTVTPWQLGRRALVPRADRRGDERLHVGRVARTRLAAAP